MLLPTMPAPTTTARAVEGKSFKEVPPSSQDRADLALERLDVRRRKLARTLCVPVADGGEQVAMLVDAALEVGQAVDHAVPDAKRQVEVPVERRGEVRVAAAAVDEAVDPRVEPHQVVRRGPPRFELVDQLGGRRAVG